MQIPKISLWLCALALGAALSVRADDNPDQAAARAALVAKLQELDAQTAAEKELAAQKEVEFKAKAKAEKAARKKAKQEAADKAAADLQAKREAEKQLAAQKKAAAAAAQAKKKSDEEAAVKAAEKLKAEKAAKAKAEKNAAAQKPAEAAAKAKVINPVEIQPTAADYPGKSLGLSPIVVPPLPISASQEAQLQALLVKYEANQITAEEYHQQRAAILAAP